MMMRIRDPHNFVWWACCNAASEYGNGANKIPIYFGVAVTQNTLLQNLNEISKKDCITRKTIKSMENEQFVIASFDNSQIFSSRKFQRGGNSSKVLLATSRMFLKATRPHAIEMYDFPTEKVELLYVCR